jgi:hypothetical protein
MPSVTSAAAAREPESFLVTMIRLRDISNRASRIKGLSGAAKASSATFRGRPRDNHDEKKSKLIYSFTYLY